MNFDYTDEQNTLRKEITEFCRAELNEGIPDRDRRGELPRDLFERIGSELRIQGLAVDKQYGGRGFDALTTTSRSEEHTSELQSR